MPLKQLLDLTGRRAIVTGGSRGLGLQIAEVLGEMGAHLVLAARKGDELDAAVAHLAEQGVTAHGIVADLGNAEAIDGFVDAALARLDHCDILVNNAGATWGAPSVDLPLAAWNKLLALNLTGTFLLTQAIGRRSMIPRKYGRILNVASIAGLSGGYAGMPTLAYNTTKGGVVNFTRALAVEWGEYGITVNALAPGFFPSKMTRGTLAKLGDRVAAHAPLRRLGGDEDLKGAAALLCSDAARHITGQILAVDGGVTAV